MVYMYLCYLPNVIPGFEFIQFLIKNIFCLILNILKLLKFVLWTIPDMSHELLKRMPDLLLKDELSYTGLKDVVGM